MLIAKINSKEIDNSSNNISDTKNKDVGKKEKKSIFIRILKFIHKKLNFTVFYLLIKSMETEFFFLAWPTLKAHRRIDTWSFLSLIIFLLGLISSFSFMILTFRAFFDYYLPKRQNFYDPSQLKDYQLNNNIVLTMFATFIKPENAYSTLSLLVFSYRDVFLPAILIFFVGSPIVQLISAFIFNWVIFFTVIITRPMSSTIETILEAFNSLCYLFCIMIMSTLFFSDDAGKDSSNNSTFGYSIITIMIISILINLIIILLFSIKRLYSSCSKGAEKSKVIDSGLSIEGNVNQVQQEENQMIGQNIDDESTLNHPSLTPLTKNTKKRINKQKNREKANMNGKDSKKKQRSKSKARNKKKNLEDVNQIHPLVSFGKMDENSVKGRKSK